MNGVTLHPGRNLNPCNIPNQSPINAATNTLPGGLTRLLTHRMRSGY